MRARFEADGDVIAITGGANGIGRALARAAAAAGARVIICDIDEPSMDIAKADNPLIVSVRLDVGDRSALLLA